MTKFSVLMPVYYKEDANRFFTSLASVFANSIIPNEVLVICDGPLTEELELVLTSYTKYQEFRVIRLKENQGIVKALNFGLKEVRHDIVVRCDSDDINHQDRFEKLISKLNTGFDVVGSQVLEVDSLGKVIACKFLPTNHSEIVSYARKRNPINHMTVVFRASQIIAVGGYPNVYLKEDYALWAKLIKAGRRFANLSDSLVSANAGIDMYKRRGGLKAAISEFDLQVTLVKCGVSTFLEALFVGLARSFVLAVPISLRAFVYRKLLRS